VKRNFDLYFRDRKIGKLIEWGTDDVLGENGENIKVKFVRFKRNDTDPIQYWQVGSYNIDYLKNKVIIGED